MKVRGHHLVCTYCFYGSGKKTASEFFGNDNAIPELLKLLQADDQLMIEVVDNLDEICLKCANYAPPNGCKRSEDAVAQNEKLRKWDRLILEHLKLKPGDRITAIALQERIRECIPDISVICTNCTSSSPSGWQEFKNAIKNGLWNR